MSIQSIGDGSKKWMAKAIVGVIAITFALFGADALINSYDSQPEVASVNGDEIRELDLAREIETVRGQIMSQMGENLDPAMLDDQLIQTQALNRLVERKLLAQDADRKDLFIDGKRVEQIIVSTEAFQSEGRFDPTRYSALLSNLGLTPLDYKNQLTQDILLQQPLLAYSRSAFVTDAELDSLIQLDRQTRNIAFLKIATEGLEKDINVSNDDALSFYEENIVQYLTEEKVSIEFLEVKRSEFFDSIEVTPEEIQENYEEELAAHADSEEREAAHILIPIDETTDEDAAETIAAEVQSKLHSGTAFADLAKEYSQDPGSAQNGGNLGYASKGVYVPEFEEALYALELGELSAPVRTEFGIHLIKLLDVRIEDPPTFEDMKADIVESLKYQKAEVLFVDAVDILENDSFSAADLVEPAENLGKEIQVTDLFSRTGGEGITANSQIINTAFSDEVLTQRLNSRRIDISRDHVVVIHIKDHEPARTLGFEEVRDEVELAVSNRRAEQQAQVLGEQILVELRSDKTPEEVAQEYGYEWVIKDKVARNDEELAANLLTDVFKLPKPGVGEKSLGRHIDDNGNFYVVTLTKIYEGSVFDLGIQERRALSRNLSQQLSGGIVTEYQLGLRNDANIQIY